MNLFSLSKSVEKPIRYLGAELNQTIKKDYKANMLLCFPDIYEIGMSHFGSKILYELININSDFFLERTYIPWVDAYKIMKSKGEKLKSIETKKEFSDFNLIGFSIPTELSYTNVLAMMELGGISPLREKRKETDPIVIAGGNTTFNLSPMSKFIDVFVIGEAEGVILDILEISSKKISKKEKLELMSKVDGVFVSGLNESVKRTIISDLNKSPLITKPVVPILEPIHNRITYEVQRGCLRGCRFCQAGIIYRPTRQRDPEDIIKRILEDVKNTGYREIGFLSLNACDYGPLLDIVDYIYKLNMDLKVSLPSLRVESINDKFLNLLSHLPKQGFTIAPEVGSERLKKVINKNITEDEILNTVELVSDLGWRSIKTYFMTGLPTEKQDDLEAIVDLAYKMRNKLKNKTKQIVISVSNFIPKPHTPFEREDELSSEEFSKKLDYLKSKLLDKKISMRWHDAKMSEIEGVLARGDEKISDVIYDVFKNGETFSAWQSEFNYDLWVSSFKKYKINVEDYLKGFKDKKLPWDIVDPGVSKKWLEEENKKAYKQFGTTFCIKEECSNCGVCKGELKNISYKDRFSFKLENKDEKEKEKEKKYKLRAFFTKEDDFTYAGHFEVMEAIKKTLLITDIPIIFSKGFNPKILFSFSPPVGLNISSKFEIVDIILSDFIDEKEFLNKINKILPKGLLFFKAKYIPIKSKSIQDSIVKIKWLAKFYEKNIVNEENINKILKINKKQKTYDIDLKEYLEDFKVLKNGKEINFSILYVGGKTIKPIDVLKHTVKDFKEEECFLSKVEMVLI